MSQQEQERVERSALPVISIWTVSPSSHEAHIVADWPPPGDGDEPDAHRVRVLRPSRHPS